MLCDACATIGYRNRFHHPNPGVFERYKARQIELARSDVDGAVRVDVQIDAPAPAVAQAGVAGHAPVSANSAPLTLERYRDTHRRYWMDR